MNRVKYFQIVKENRPKTHRFKDCFLAFFGGGTIGLLSQALIDFLNKTLNYEMAQAMAFTSLLLVCFSSVLTVLSIYNSLGQTFGAGLFVPITGFSNSMVSSSLEGKSEGFVVGIGGRIFSLAGSVIAFGPLTTLVSFKYVSLKIIVRLLIIRLQKKIIHI